MIKAPFNFVPLADKVFFPKWADQVSQDLPFSDGLDGYLTVELTAKTPVFVRNGHSKAEGESKSGNYASAAITHDGRYYLPATSVKGMVRNILEILSYGKMNVDDKAMFAQREWDNTSLYTIKNINEQKRLRCGWLVRRDGEYYIRRCVGTPYRINHLRLDECLNTKLFFENFSKDAKKIARYGESRKELTDEEKTAVYKYRLLEECGIDRSLLKGFRFSEDIEYAVEFQERRVMMDPSGDISGTIVLTGQPDLAKWPINGYNRKMGDGKFYEFVFSNEIEGETPLTQAEFDHFKFIYQNSPDWEYGKELLDGDGIPVFFRMRGDNIRDFGLAFLYKLPYENSPADLEQAGHRYQGHSRNDCDLADCIFGYARGQKAVKGRVQFSHFFSENAEPDKNYTLVLNGPKASYYPIYIQQDGQNGTTARYMTYNDGRLAGWKRYHVRNLVWEKKTGDPKLDTTIYPLKEESTFFGRVYFHNLKPEELGALVSAITFHGDEEHCFHQIGQAKPYGFGKLAVRVIDTYIDRPSAGYDNHGLRFFMAQFEQLMNKTVPSWYCSAPITQLFTIARQDVTADDIYKYMELTMRTETTEGNNEFVDEKRANHFLMAYSQLSRQTYTAPSHTEILKEMQLAIENLKPKVEKLKSQKELVRLYLKAKDMKSALTEFSAAEALAKELLADKDYQNNKDNVDPIVNDERATDLDTLRGEIEGTGGPEGPKDSLADFIGKASSPDQVNGRVKTWLKEGHSIDGEYATIAAKLAESFVAKKMRNAEVKDWLDETKIDRKWKKWIELVGPEVTRLIFDELKKL